MNKKLIKYSFFKKRAIFATLLLVILLFFLAWRVFAASSPEYGSQYFPYTKEKTYSLTGDLTPSGPGRPELEYALRQAHALWTDVRFKDLTTNAWSEFTPAGKYLATIAFNILEETSDDDFNQREGYHLVPLHEGGNYESVRLVAKWANGNPDYIINKLKEGSDNSNYYLRENNRYYVGAAIPSNTWYRFTSLVALSGAGLNYDTDMVAQEPVDSVDRGVSFPSFKNTYYTTPWPKIYTIYGSENDEERQLISSQGNLRISTRTYSYWGNKHKLWFLEGKFSEDQIMEQINNTTAQSGKSDDTRFDAFAKNAYLNIETGDLQSFNYNTNLPLKDISDVLTTDGVVRDYTLVVSDGYDRIAVQNFKLGVYDPDLAVDESSISISPEQPQAGGTAATVSVDVQNLSTADIASTYLLWRWNSSSTVQTVPIANFAAGETRTLNIDVTYPDHSDILIFNINGNKDSPPNEIDWENNRAEYKIGAGQINLRALQIAIDPLKPQVGDEVRFLVQVENESYTETVENTHLDWWVNSSKQTRITGITLEPRQKKWISGLTVPSAPDGDKITMKAEINSDRNRPENEVANDGGDPWADNVISGEYLLNEDALNLSVSSISSGTATKHQDVTTRIVVKRDNLKEDVDEAKTYKVRLYLLDSDGNQSLVGTEDATLPEPGSEQTIMMSWNTGSHSIGNYTLVATINLPPTQGETTYQDNTLTAGFTIYGEPGNGYCGVTNHTTDISGEYRYCVKHKTSYDENGKKERECVKYDTGYYYEHFNSEFTSPLSGTFVAEDADEINGRDVELVRTGSTTIKAGQGISFVIKSRYTEDRGKTGNIKRAVAHIPLADGSIQNVELEKISSDTNEVTWGLPIAWVAKHGDEVIYRNTNPGSNDPEDDSYYYPGGRAFYTSLSMPAGTYSIGVDLYAEGVNNLTQCLRVSFAVEGNLMEDFYVRQINPDHPFPTELFPSGPTKIWRNATDLLTDLTDWINFDNNTITWPN